MGITRPLSVLELNLDLYLLVIIIIILIIIPIPIIPICIKYYVDSTDIKKPSQLEVKSMVGQNLEYKFLCGL